MIMPVCQLGSEVEEKMNNMNLNLMGLVRVFLFYFLDGFIILFTIYLIKEYQTQTEKLAELILGCLIFAGIMTTYFYVRFIRNKNKKNDE